MTMAHLPPLDGGAGTVTVAVYSDYATAQRAVDFLSDNKFPVHEVTIVGEDIRLIEHVLGRMTILRAAATGAISGAWFGLLIGLLLGLFAESSWLTVLIVATLIGAVWGAVFGAIAHAVTGGQRDFRSVSTLQAARYGLRVPSEHVDSARQLLATLDAQTAGTSPM
jgi:Heat induced stress protein YflT domain